MYIIIYSEYLYVVEFAVNFVKSESNLWIKFFEVN